MAQTAANIPAPDYRLEDQIGFRLRKAHQTATEIFLAEAGDADVTPQQLAVLVTLRGAGELTHGALGQATAMDPATLMGVVQRLVKRGLVGVRTDPADGRRRLAKLSPGGRRLADRLRAVGTRISARTLEPLTENEQRILLDLLERIAQPRSEQND